MPSLGRGWIEWAGRQVTNAAGALATAATAVRPLNRSRVTADEDANPLVYFSGRTQAGVYVDPSRAMRQAAVWACVTYLSRTIAQLPWQVMQSRPNGGADRMETHPVDWLLNVRPNPEMGSFTFRQTMMGSALRYGNGYAEIVRDLRGVPMEMWVIHPSRMRVERNDSGQLIYLVSNNTSEDVELQAFEVFHVRGFGDGPVGMNVIQFAAQSIGWAQATELFGSSHFGEGLNPSGIIEVPGEMSPEGMKQLRAAMHDLYRGRNRTMFLDGGMKWQKVSSNPEESQFVSTMQHQVEEICRWFGVPPHKVQHMLRSTFSNIESQNIEVVVDSIVPWVRVFEDEAIYKLFGQNRQGLFTRMNVNGLLRGDTAARAQFYKEMWAMGAYSPNEIRALEDENPIGKEGDARFVPVNFQTLENALKPPKAPPPAPSPQPGQGQDAGDGTGDQSPPAARLNGHANGHERPGNVA